MVVTSPTVQIIITSLFDLTLAVFPSTGDRGDTFTFSGVLVQDGAAVSGEVVNVILQDVGQIGSDVTDIDGQFLITWVADRTGTLTLYAEAPNIGAESRTITLGLLSDISQLALAVIPPIAVGLVLLSRK